MPSTSPLPPTTVASNEALVESWRLSLHQKSPATIEQYLYNARLFTTWLIDEGRPAAAPGDLLAVERRDVERFLNELRDRGLSVSTRRARWVALRSFYGFLVHDDELDESPVAKVTAERAVPPPAPVVPVDDLRVLLKACEGRTYEDRRDYALIRLLVATGLRVGEAAGLRVDDLDLAHRTAVIRRGKGGKARIVRFDPATANHLDRFRRARARHRLADTPALFLGRQGPLTPSGMATALKRRATAAGVGGLHPHALRHAWTHLAKSAGMSDEDVMRLGGWSDPTVMHRYASGRATDRALAAYDRADPMSEL